MDQTRLLFPNTSSGGKLPTILIVDDNLANLELLLEMLQEEGFRVRRATSGTSALRGARAIQPDLILLDINMSGMNGYEVCQKLKADSITADIPIIFISALASTFDKVKAFQVGGVDYINKPFQLEEVLMRVKTQLTLKWAKAEVEYLNQDLERRIDERTQELALEISERELTQKKLAHLAWHDSLTGLPNRSWLMQHLDLLLTKIHEQTGTYFVLLFLDCDRFKVVNDSLGHRIGDQLLVSLAQRLNKCLPEKSVLARLGGDEFTILLESVQDIKQAEMVAKKLQNALINPFQVAQFEFSMGVSIGIVQATTKYQRSEDLLRDADIAMYASKREGGGCYKLFDQEMHEQALKTLRLESELRQALEYRQIEVAYQPIFSLKQSVIVGCEALVRLNHREKGTILPGEFIPLAEETGLILTLGRQVMEIACKQLKVWQELFLLCSDDKSCQFEMSVNLSVKQFSQPDLCDNIDQILKQTDAMRQGLKLEITESAIVDDPELAATVLRQLKEFEISLSIDDFGTGYSSLSYLRQFPADTLKIDRSFVNRINQSKKDYEIVRTIISLAHILDMTVIAEGIETTEQLESLQRMGCDMGQGYLFARPLSADDMERLMAKQFGCDRSEEKNYNCQFGCNPVAA